MLFAGRLSKNFSQITSVIARILGSPEQKPELSALSQIPSFTVHVGTTRFGNEQAIVVEADRFEDCAAGLNSVRQRLPDSGGIACFGEIIPTSSRKFVCVGRILYV